MDKAARIARVVPTSEGHARMRKLLSPALTRRAVKTQEPIVQQFICLLIERLRERSTVPDEAGSGKGLVLDIVPWFIYATIGIFGDLGFGESFSASSTLTITHGLCSCLTASRPRILSLPRTSIPL